MEKFIPPEFDLPLKGRSEEALKRWRDAVGKLVKNRRRRFRYAAVLEKRSEAKEQMRRLRENIRVCFVAYTAALRFIDGGHGKKLPSDDSNELLEDDTEIDIQNGLLEEARLAGFQIHPDKLASVVASYDIKTLRKLKGVEGLADRLNVSVDKGVNSSDVATRQNIFGPNHYTEKPPKSFWTFVWEALHDLTLIILIVCAVVSIGVGLATEGWPKGMYDGLGIILSIFLVVMVTAVSDYKQSLQFKELDKEKKKIFVQVIRDGTRQKVSIYDLVVGDIVHLSIGDQVPADGSKVQDGSGKMLVTTVGMRTEWGKLMETLSEGGEDETPLQVKLNGVATIIGRQHAFTKWSSSDALKLLNYFATAVTIIVVAVPEGLPLAVTLSLAFAMKKLMNDKALVRHLSASKEVDTNGGRDTLDTEVSEHVITVLFQAIFTNTGSEVVKNKDGKISILGTPTESAILEYGLLLGGDFQEVRGVCKLLKVEPFNSEKKKMSVLVALPEGKIRAFCKGASEIILKTCDRVLNANGESVPLSEEQVSNVMDVINGFACEALRTLCLAFKDIDDGSHENSIPDCGYTLIAVVGIKDPVRHGVKEAVKTCLAAGITVRMVTGDNINTAKAIARECGMLTDGDLAIEGPDFRQKTSYDEPTNAET
ncbi:putative calcium-transporting ATPase 9, plasma membrane-type [Sesamum angolense]|uniref:P-type Cu(+) transporter n=1 Tax=Sesamum angolense TaxID=2727404 RepID=A0AAE1X4Z1_9LAMI|nr:putative calcium-transporting ATPase 9, plasma membrane-type [Sesamum angolense]